MGIMFSSCGKLDVADDDVVAYDADQSVVEQVGVAVVVIGAPDVCNEWLAKVVAMDAILLICNMDEWWGDDDDDDCCCKFPVFVLDNIIGGNW